MIVTPSLIMIAGRSFEIVQAYTPNTITQYTYRSELLNEVVLLVRVDSSALFVVSKL
jgi:hypothetical protein